MTEEPTQWTPQGERIPVPTEDDFLRDLRKVAKAPEKASDARPDASGAEDEQ